MDNITTDPDNYLIGRKSTSIDKSTSLSSIAQSFTFPTLKSPLSSTSSQKEEDFFLKTKLILEPTHDEVRTSSNDDKCLEDQLPSVGKKQRILGFIVCLLVGVLCLSLSTVYIPVLMFKAKTFALLFSLGNTFLVCSFSCLWGPMNHMKHMLKKERRLYTTLYLGTLTLTLYLAIGIQSTILTTLAVSGQALAVTWFVISHLPGGQTGLKFLKWVSTFLFCTKLNGKDASVAV